MIKKNILSILVALIILYLSLAKADTFKKVSFISFPNIDKVVHFGMYFGFMSVIIFENRKTIKKNSQLFLTGLIPLFYGILMEFLQAVLTVDRFADIYDVLFNTIGILISIFLWLWIKPFVTVKSDGN
jgi:VanZ family protein